MKVFRLFYAILFVTALFLTGCGSSLRFTHEEIKDYPLDIQEKIIRGEVAPGMTQQQVRYTWGAPNSIRSLNPLNGKSREEWIYSNTIGYRVRLLFIEGKLGDITEGMFLRSSEQKPKRQESK